MVLGAPPPPAAPRVQAEISQGLWCPCVQPLCRRRVWASLRGAPVALYPRAQRELG